MRYILTALYVGLFGCTQLIAQEYKDDLAKCKEPDLSVLAKDEAKSTETKKAELAIYGRCNLSIQQEYYPEYAPLWQRHLANQELHFAQVLDGKLSSEEAKVLDAESYAALNKEATAMNMAARQLEMQQNALQQQQAAQIQQNLLDQQLQRQQLMQSVTPQRTHCTYDVYGNTIDSTCW